LLGVWLPPANASGSAAGSVTAHERTEPAAQRNPLTKPYADPQRIRLPRFDRAALRMAATSEATRLSASWTAVGRRFVLRESGPSQVDVLVEMQRVVPAGQVLPVRVFGPAGGRDYYMVFTGESSGRSAGMLRLTSVHDWIDVTVGAETTLGELDAQDPAVRDALTVSVRATPDPWMSAWAEFVASRPSDDPLRQLIENAAR